MGATVPETPPVALVLAVYRHEVQRLVEAAPVLLKTHPPIEALRLWMDRLAHYGMTKAGLADALSTATTSSSWVSCGESIPRVTGGREPGGCSTCSWTASAPAHRALGGRLLAH